MKENLDCCLFYMIYHAFSKKYHFMSGYVFKFFKEMIF